MTVVAMHQPTFFPWLGWWDKLVRADVLVLLDDVQYPKKGGTWMNRTRILVQGKPAWISVPIDRRYHGFRTVRETVVDETKPWRATIAKTVASNYARARYFDEVFPVVEELLEAPMDRLTALNEAAILRVGLLLHLDTSKLVHQSEVDADGQGTDLLISLCRAVGGTTYMTGDGAEGYLEPDKFGAAHVKLVEQRFTPPIYPQAAADFVPGLSVIDALMQCGWDGTTRLLTERGRPPS